MNNDNEEQLYGVKLNKEQASKLLECRIPTMEMYTTQEEDLDDYEYGIVESFKMNINWIFEKLTFIYDLKSFWIVFERGYYGDEPKDDNEYCAWLCQVIINKSGDLSDSQIELIRNLKFKKLTTRNINSMFKTLDAMECMNKYAQ